MNVANHQDDELLVGFIDESVDGLRDLPSRLEKCCRDPDDSDAVNSVFRAVHSIKGNAGFFGLVAIKKFAHAMENTLDDVRNGKVRIDDDLQRTFIQGFDLLDEMLQRVLNGDVDEVLGKEESRLLDAVAELADKNRTEETPEEMLLREALALAEEVQGTDLEQSSDWAERIRRLVSVDDAFDAHAGDGEPVETSPESYAEATCLAGEADVTDRVAKLLDLFLLSRDGAYTDQIGMSFLDAADEFAQWADQAGQVDLAATLQKAKDDFQTIFDSPLDIDSMLLSVIWEVLEPELVKIRTISADEGDDSADDPELEEAATGPDVAATVDQSAQTEKAKARLVRVKEEYLDEFMDDVSDLFITCERLKDLHSRMAVSHSLESLVEELRQINGDFTAQSAKLQHSVVGLRRLPVRGLFAKFPRLARSLATDLGKKVDVHLVGEETEVDKSLVEDLDAPLTHMVRNVVDHGIEPPEQRIERGVGPVGNMWLKAELTRTHVVIQVEDDGRGIDPNRLRAKVVEKGILSQSQADSLSDQEAIELVFHAGLSTAEKVSEVSGRGVGLDVVRTTLQDYGGDVKIESQFGEGTTFRLEIPIRQAVLVIDSLLLKEGANNFAMPLESIREIVELDSSSLKTVQGKRVATVRGVPHAAVHLDDLLDLSVNDRPKSDSPTGLLITGKHGDFCLLVEKVVGQRKVVVNSLDGVMDCTDRIAGVAQLGAGQLALVLSATDLVKTVKRSLPV